MNFYLIKKKKMFVDQTSTKKPEFIVLYFVLLYVDLYFDKNNTNT